MKHILILGAGLMQEPAIDAAHDLGYYVTVFDGNEHALCKIKCDTFETIDLKHTDKLVKRATEIHLKQPFSAVFTAGTDFSLAVSSIALACNLPSHTVQSAKNASDKITMRSCFEAHGVPSPHFIEVSKNTDLNIVTNFIKRTSYPIVVKPCDNMGARGCRLARNDTELQESIEDAISYSKTSRAIVEEYMEGPEFSIDALVYNNEVTITGFADRHIFYPPYFIEMGHSIPTDIDSNNYEQLVKTFVQGIHSLGLTHGAAKADIKLTKKGPMVGEIAARLSGGYMSGWTFPYASGLNLTKEGLCIALNKQPDQLLKGRKKFFDNVAGYSVYDYPCNKHCVERAWISIPGEIENVILSDETIVKNVFPRLNMHDIAVFPVNNVQKAGNVISIASTRNEAIEKAKHFLDCTFLTLKMNQKTVDFINQDLHTEFPPSAYNLPLEVYEKVAKLPKEKIETTIKIPEFLYDYIQEHDWNGRTLEKTIQIINDYLKHNQVREKEPSKVDVLPSFWYCVIRAGIQGGLFYLF